MNSIIPEIETVVENATATIEPDEKPSESLNSSTQIQTHANSSMGVSDYMVAFSGHSQSYCIGFVDMVNSTKISSNLNEKDWCKYYAIFLNSMAKIIQRFGGQAIKNGGDSLLYYFPESSNPKSKFGFISCLECSLAMIEAHDYICAKVQNEGLPPLDYRVSADYGKVVLMESNNTNTVDVIGPPVNMCVKINHIAASNRVVIGGDLYEMVKDLNDYSFKSKHGLSIGLKFDYPIYSLKHKRGKFHGI
ncbi:MAG: adenylate/guanylate cyclase domain-containing protein [Nitrososphaeraceae archaeon]|nr:adenylate/guanylate cyclase domain-containing protein [Nitrososphaeraceae archaeon]